jgi:TonB family protein
MPLNRFGSFGSSGAGSGAATGAARAPIRLPAGRAPQLDIAWGSFHQGIGSCLGVVFSKSPVPKKFTIEGFFKYCWVESKLPRRALIAAALWHIVFFVMPFPQFPARAHHNPAFDNVELSWSGPINDLPLLDMKAPKPEPKPRSQPEKPRPPEGADAFHPRQHIFSDPAHPNHPRQTLINSAAPPEPPKILPSLPNIVQIQEMPGPAKPRLLISKEELAKLRPKQRRVATVTDAPTPDVPVFEQKPGDVAMIAATNGPARPKLELNAGAAPRIAQKAQTGDAGPAPDVGATQLAGANNNSSTLIALSAAPAPPAPVAPPQGNLAARVSISPEGKKPGVPGGSPKGTATEAGAGGNTSSNGGTGAGNNVANGPIDISIRGGNPPANKGTSGLAATPRISAPTPHTLITRPEPHAEDEPVRTGPPNFAALPPGAKPEQIFESKKIYKMQIEMPNLNSATGSWILNFAELRPNPDAPRGPSTDLNGPAPIRKVDPKYPPTLINEHVEGEVVLYAVIRRDGSVDSIQLVRGVDEELDKNAMNALSQWKFRPATRQGEPVELEAIIHIPFHAPDDRQ